MFFSAMKKFDSRPIIIVESVVRFPANPEPFPLGTFLQNALSQQFLALEIAFQAEQMKNANPLIVRMRTALLTFIAMLVRDSGISHLCLSSSVFLSGVLHFLSDKRHHSPQLSFPPVNLRNDFQ
jgi:hypothetical protein